jgi:hypothetical protein
MPGRAVLRILNLMLIRNLGYFYIVFKVKVANTTDDLQTLNVTATCLGSAQ